jgi:arginyl-tRNA synthetase
VTGALREALHQAAGRLGVPDAEFVVERPRDAGHGDFATNLAMVVARSRRVNPRVVAQELLDALELPAGLVSRTEIAGPGFVNFWLSDLHLADEHARILAEGAHYGRGSTMAGQRVNVEFVSANPTGPLHVGHGRGAALGDGIAALLEWAGAEVVREF